MRIEVQLCNAIICKKLGFSKAYLSLKYYRKQASVESVFRIVFDEVIPMSAKFSRPSVISVKDKIRDWLDRHHDLEHFDLRQRPQIGGELARLNVDSGPRLV